MKYRCLYSNRYGKGDERIVKTASEAVDFVMKYSKASKEDAVEIVNDVTLMNSVLLDIDPYHSNKSILIEGISEEDCQWYKAEFEDDEFELILADSDEDALQQAFDMADERRDTLFNLFAIDDNYDNTRTIF